MGIPDLVLDCSLSTLTNPVVVRVIMWSVVLGACAGGVRGLDVSTRDCRE